MSLDIPLEVDLVVPFSVVMILLDDSVTLHLFASEADEAGFTKTGVSATASKKLTWSSPEPKAAP